MKSIKKTILAAFLAISALGMTSCNKDVEQREFTPQEILAINVSDLMRNGLFNVFAYEEGVSAKIANGETLNSAITIITDEVSGDTIGWTSDFSDEQILLKGTIRVTFDGSLLADNTIKTIDCSQITINDNTSNSLKFFGTVEVENISSSATETSREVRTNQFGWGTTNNDVYLNTFYYRFDNKYSNGTMTECKISGNAGGYHVSYGTFSQDIITSLIVGQYTFFTGGEMSLEVAEFGGYAYPVDVTFTPNSMVITYNGETFIY
ncbi:MAG: hypothetical protein LBC68_03375 [Prevotellaceae bacterium]|jgi:hypothetical protein|nr:hypothetical protein [Prevotellaceae bacterium]